MLYLAYYKKNYRYNFYELIFNKAKWQLILIEYGINRSLLRQSWF